MATRTEAYRRKHFTMLALRQQQLAWNLYLSEGVVANLEHALRTNCFCLTAADVRAMKEQLRNAQKAVAFWRNEFVIMKGEK